MLGRELSASAARYFYLQFREKQGPSVPPGYYGSLPWTRFPRSWAEGLGQETDLGRCREDRLGFGEGMSSVMSVLLGATNKVGTPGA